MSKIYLIYENEQWLAPLTNALDRIDAPYQRWSMIDGHLDLRSQPPKGVFFNRMSASAHTRGYRYSPEYSTCVINWLEGYGRRVINGGNTINLEISKTAQYIALRNAGIEVPRTQTVLGTQQLLRAAKQIKKPFIIKHNRGGKGLSVKLIHDIKSLEAFLFSHECEPPIDGLWLIQEYIQSPEPYIIRTEFINGKLVYAVKVNTEQGFELCPADVCETKDVFCLLDSEAKDKFEIIDGFNHPLIQQYETFMTRQNLDIAAFEFIQDENNNAYTYDINTNTNYNSQAEQKAGIYAYQHLAQFLIDELRSVDPG